MTPIIYKGRVIFRNEDPGKVRYYARTDQGQVCAYTLREIKEAITRTECGISSTKRAATTLRPSATG